MKAGTPVINEDYNVLKPHHPTWIDADDWENMIDRLWNTEQWKIKSRAEKQNRSSLIDGQKKQFGRDVNAFELFTHTHTRRGLASGEASASASGDAVGTGSPEYVTTRAKNVAEKYWELLVEKYGPDQANHSRVGDLELWEQACGGRKKGRLYGFAEPTDPFLVLTGAPSTPSTAASYAHHPGMASADEVETLKQQLEERDRITEEREKAAAEQEHTAAEQERAAAEREKALMARMEAEAARQEALRKELEKRVKAFSDMMNQYRPPSS